LILVVAGRSLTWCGELGRQSRSYREHAPFLEILIPGSGRRIQGGITYGTTDELGYAAEENPVSVHDFHATMLHLLGVDHKRLVEKYQGRM